MFKRKLIRCNRITSIGYAKKKKNNKKQKQKKQRDETIIHIVSECSKLAQKEYKTRHKWAGKDIHWQLCKRLKFDHTTWWYKKKPESVLENETHKIIWDFKIEMDYLILIRRPDGVIIIKTKQNKTKYKKPENFSFIEPQWKWKWKKVKR